MGKKKNPTRPEHKKESWFSRTGKVSNGLALIVLLAVLGFISISIQGLYNSNTQLQECQDTCEIYSNSTNEKVDEFCNDFFEWKEAQQPAEERECDIVWIEGEFCLSIGDVAFPCKARICQTNDATCYSVCKHLDCGQLEEEICLNKPSAEEEESCVCPNGMPCQGCVNGVCMYALCNVYEEFERQQPTEERECLKWNSEWYEDVWIPCFEPEVSLGKCTYRPTEYHDYYKPVQVWVPRTNSINPKSTVENRFKEYDESGIPEWIAKPLYKVMGDCKCWSDQDCARRIEVDIEYVPRSENTLFTCFKQTEEDCKGYLRDEAGVWHDLLEKCLEEIPCEELHTAEGEPK